MDVNGVGISTREQTVSAPSNAAFRVARLEVPEQARGGVVFVKLSLLDGEARVLAENFYWHAAQKAGYRKLRRRITVEIPRPPGRMKVELKGWNVRAASFAVVAAR